MTYLRRIALSLLAVGIGTAAALTTAGSASAYPGTTDASMALSSTVVTPGGGLTATGTGFKPGETVTLTLFSVAYSAGSGTAAPDGTVSISTAIPPDFALGEHTAQLYGLTSGTLTSASFTVTTSGGLAFTGEGQGSGGGLAFTGVAVGVTVTLAVGLIGAGAILMLSGRRRTS